MINDIGKILLNELDGLPFLDKYAGVVRVIKYREKTDTGAVTKTFPADCQISLDDCMKGKRYMDLCPDSKKKSVLYFEDKGIRLMGRKGNIMEWRASLDLVCWLNLPLLGVTDSCSYSATAILAILAKWPTVPFNAFNMYQYASINVVGENSKAVSPFAKYTYDETVNQFLMYPYDYFSLAVDVEFRLDKRCLQIDTLNPADNCLKK